MYNLFPKYTHKKKRNQNVSILFMCFSDYDHLMKGGF